MRREKANAEPVCRCWALPRALAAHYVTGGSRGLSPPPGVPGVMGPGRRVLQGPFDSECRGAVGAMAEQQWTSSSG